MPNHWLTVTSLLTALFELVYTDAVCYYAANHITGSAIIPCSTAPGFASCCQLGDICLSDNACWNAESNTTYLYGCTDPSFNDNTCPYKCGATYAGSPWVVLGYCFDSGAARQWTCKHPTNSSPSVEVVPDNTPPICNNVSLIAFAGSNQLQPIVSLPLSIGGVTATFVSTTGIYSPTTLTATTSISTNSGKGLGVGLGIGLGLGLSLLVGAFCTLWFRRQKRRKRATTIPTDSIERRAELQSEGYGKPKHELLVEGIAHEKDGKALEQPPAELKGTSQVHELPGSSPGSDHKQGDSPHS